MDPNILENYAKLLLDCCVLMRMPHATNRAHFFIVMDFHICKDSVVSKIHIPMINVINEIQNRRIMLKKSHVLKISEIFPAWTLVRIYMFELF